MSDRDMTRIRFGGDGMYADQLNEYAEELARLRAQVGRLQSGMRRIDRWWWGTVGEPHASGDDAEMTRLAKLKPGDLDPLEDDDA